MKKRILIAAMAVAVLTLSGCGSADTAALREEISSLRERVAVLEAQMSAMQAPVQKAPAQSEPVQGEQTQNEPIQNEQIQNEQVQYEPGQSVQLKEEHRLIAEMTEQLIASEAFVGWQETYRELTGNAPNAPRVESALRYEIPDFEGEKMDCWLVNISADVGRWFAADQGVAENRVLLFIDLTSGKVYDSFSTDAMNAVGDLSIAEGRAIYMLWYYYNDVNGQCGRPWLNDSETMTELTVEDIDAINAYLE